MDTRIISVSNIKGGVGKTTTVVNLAAGLARLGRRVLVIDADSQSNATFALCGPAAPAVTLYDVLMGGEVSLPEIITTTNASGVELAPSHINLSSADMVLAAVAGRERLLARRLRDVDGYDYILIDTPPSLGLMSVNSLTAATEVFIPVGVGTFALLGIGLLEATIAQLRENLEMDTPRVTGVMATLYDRTRVAEDTIAALRTHFGERLFATIIPKYKDIQESQGRSLSIFEYAPGSQAERAFHNLAQEVIHGEEEARRPRVQSAAGAHRG